jgi:hypothetical protein
MLGLPCIVAMLSLATAFKIDDLKITSDNPALQSPFAKQMLKQMVDDELRKHMPQLVAAARAEKGVQAEKPVEQTLEVEMRQTAGEEGEKLTVVVVSTWQDGSVTRETMPA